jgi:hypothetical protein
MTQVIEHSKGYVVFNLTNKKYCGPRYFLDSKKQLACNFSDTIHQIGGGLLLNAAIKYMRGFEKTFPRSQFEIHRVEMRVTVVRKIRGVKRNEP